MFSIMAMTHGSSADGVLPIPQDQARGLMRGRAVGAAGREFESFVLQTFVEAMLPKETSGVFGVGMAGAFWRSMMAEQIARELARSGGIGIGDLVADDIASAAGAGR